MTDDLKRQQALKTYEVLCKALDARDWHYNRHDEDLVITCGVKGDDLPMDMIIMVREKQQVVSLISVLPFKIGEEQRIDGALAVCAANYGLINGSFDYDLTDGEVRFRLVTSFRNTELDEDVFDYMIMVSANTIDEYNDRFLMLGKGMITLQKFLEMESN